MDKKEKLVPASFMGQSFLMREQPRSHDELEKMRILEAQSFDMLELMKDIGPRAAEAGEALKIAMGDIFMNDNKKDKINGSEPHKRYIIFAGSYCYPCGGTDDLIGSSGCPDEALKILNDYRADETIMYTWGEIYDTDDKITIYNTADES